MMGKIIEYSLVSIDGVFEGPPIRVFFEYWDNAYMYDGAGQAMACRGLVMGRTTYNSFEEIWQARKDPWAQALNVITKYVFSSTPEKATWNNTTIIRGDVISEATRLKEQDGGNFLIYGHGRLTETLLTEKLIDVVDFSIHPLIVGSGKQFFRENLEVKMKLVATKNFAKGIVMLTLERQY
ncbi:MAG TPA: dihydrofolate reductase family protein [Mucilaginibacter sp.]|jgi:dihydrofolate reductase